MEAVEKEKIYPLEEYFELEKSTSEKFEYWEGNVRSMSGASFAHNRIVMNLSPEIGTKIRDKGCGIFPAGMRIKVPKYPPYRYPELTALCGKAEIENKNGLDLLVNPQLIVEVLSDSTEAFDQGDKFSFYKSIESFTEYILVAQHRPHVSQFAGRGDRFWIQKEFNDLSDTAKLESVPCELLLTAVYRDVSFPPSNFETEIK